MESLLDKMEKMPFHPNTVPLSCAKAYGYRDLKTCFCFTSPTPVSAVLSTYLLFWTGQPLLRKQLLPLSCSWVFFFFFQRFLYIYVAVKGRMVISGFGDWVYNLLYALCCHSQGNCINQSEVLIFKHSKSITQSLLSHEWLRKLNLLPFQPADREFSMDKLEKWNITMHQ